MEINQKIDLPVEEAREIFIYNPDTGIIRWRKTRGFNAKAGEEAGHRHIDGYRIIQIKGRNYLAHRIAWVLSNGFWPECPMDHRDGIKDNNDCQILFYPAPNTI